MKFDGVCIDLVMDAVIMGEGVVVVWLLSVKSYTSSISLRFGFVVFLVLFGFSLKSGF